MLSYLVRNAFTGAKHVLVVVLVTACIGATWNTVYEFIFDKAAWNAGPPLLRWLFTVALTAPFILAALVVIGLPATWILAKLRTEGLLQYALAGVIGGLLFWPIVIVPWSWFDGIPSGLLPAAIAPTRLLIMTAIYGIACAACWFLIARRGRTLVPRPS